jgi:hypothetical protein
MFNYYFDKIETEKKIQESASHEKAIFTGMDVQ